MAKVDSLLSPTGVAIHPWINKPDTKFKDYGEFHTKLRLSGGNPETEVYIKKVTENCDAAFAKLTKDLTPAERRKWHTYYPFEAVLDDDGKPTGDYDVTFKRNHNITVNGEAIELGVYIYDAVGNDIPADKAPSIFNGTELRVGSTFRDVKVNSTHAAGSKLDMFGVNVMKLAPRTGGRGSMFQNHEEPEEGGYVWDDKSPGDANATAQQGDADTEMPF